MAHPTQIDARHHMPFDAKSFGDFRGGCKLDPVALAVVEAERVALVLVTARHGQAGRRVHTPTEQAHRFSTGDHSWPGGNSPGAPVPTVRGNFDASRKPSSGKQIRPPKAHCMESTSDTQPVS